MSIPFQMLGLMLLGFATAGGPAGPQAAGRTVAVSGSEALDAAILRATGGDRIILAPGSYRALRVSQRAFRTPLTITGARGGKVQLEGLAIADVQGLKIANLTIDRPSAPGEPRWTDVSSIVRSSRVELQDVAIIGGAGPNEERSGYGLTVRDSRDVSLATTKFSGLAKGLMIIKSAGVSVRSSLFVDLKEDGINSAAADDLVIDGNIFARFHPEPGDHPDAIQMYNSNQKQGQSRIRIENNVIVQLTGTGTQGIWISDPGAYGFSDLIIRNNLIQSNDMWNGIGLFGASKALVTGNTLISDRADEKTLWIRVESSSDVVLSNNVYEALLEKKVSNITRQGNIDSSKQKPNRTAYKKGARPDFSMFDFGGSGFKSSISGVPSLDSIVER